MEWNLCASSIRRLRAGKENKDFVCAAKRSWTLRPRRSLWIVQDRPKKSREETLKERFVSKTVFGFVSNKI